MAKSEDQPFSPLLTADNELIHLAQDTLASTSVPGWPLLSLTDEQGVQQRLQADLSTERLRLLYSILFLTSRPENISPLHHQAIKRRNILITEQPDMHLLWYYDRIFIKPIPKYLFSAHFWELYVVRKTPDSIRQGSRSQAEEEGCMMREATGFLRTYARLIQHESDFELAKDLRLIPSGMGITWESWSRYIASFATLRDRDLSKRYHFGEIRMTRLNFWTSILYGRSYEPVHYNYMTYFARFGAPYLFVFGAVTVLLTALQTGLDMNQHVKDGGTIYHELATGFVPFALFLTTAGLTSVPMLFVTFYALEWYHFLFHYQPHS